MHVLHSIVCRVWLYVCDAHYVYVHMVEENALGVCWVWKQIQSAYWISKKLEDKDWLKDKYQYFISLLIMHVIYDSDLWWLHVIYDFDLWQLSFELTRCDMS